MCQITYFLKRNKAMRVLVAGFAEDVPDHILPEGGTATRMLTNPVKVMANHSHTEKCMQLPL
jgi:hypothetical protein